MQNNNDFFVSIITPNYNGEKYLEETIVSVISQTNKNFEFLISDGNSRSLTSTSEVIVTGFVLSYISS